MENKLNWEDFKEFFPNGWAEKVKPFFETEEAFNIYSFLKERSREKNLILPESSKVFRCFQECDYNNLKVVCMGMEPYSSVYKDVIVADGLAFSCSNTMKLQPSLETFLNGIESDVYNGLCLTCPKNPDLTYLANQGVLLTNISLTVEKNKISSHASKGLWLPFWRYMIENVFNIYNPGLVYLLLGKEAEKVERWILPFNNYIFKAVHPSFAARTQSDWQHNNIFSKTNRILNQNLGKEFEINWLNKPKEEEITESDCPF